jgi:hypothetical protein
LFEGWFVDYGRVISNKDAYGRCKKIRMQNDHWDKRHNSPASSGSLPLAALIPHELIADGLLTTSPQTFIKNQFGTPLQLRIRCGILTMLVSTSGNCNHILGKN